MTLQDLCTMAPFRVLNNYVFLLLAKKTQVYYCTDTNNKYITTNVLVKLIFEDRTAQIITCSNTVIS